jgi:uncharacterized protein YdhG (YjbR/CyaY superfamily)
MKMQSYKNVDEYIRSFPKDVQMKLKQIRQLVRKTIPRAEEGISYKIPTYKINGKYVVYFAAFKKHISIFPILRGKDAIKELTPYVTGKGTAQFPLDKPIPLNLIKKFVQFRVKEHLSKSK